MLTHCAQCVEKAVAALSNLATRKPCREAIRKNGGVVPLVALLDTEIPELLCGSAGTLANMGECGFSCWLWPTIERLTAAPSVVQRASTM